MKKSLQSRSRTRKQLILTAAIKLFAEKGYDNVSTRHIATEANVSIGSVYQYFPNKQAILDGLQNQLLDNQQQLLTSIYIEKYNNDLSTFLTALVDRLAVFFRDNHTLMKIFNTASSEEVHAAAYKLNQIRFNRIDARIAAFLPHLEDDERRLYTAMSMQLVGNLLAFAQQSTPENQVKTIDQLKDLLTYFWLSKNA